MRTVAVIGSGTMGSGIAQFVLRQDGKLGCTMRFQILFRKVWILLTNFGRVG